MARMNASWMPAHMRRSAFHSRSHRTTYKLLGHTLQAKNPFRTRSVRRNAKWPPLCLSRHFHLGQCIHNDLIGCTCWIVYGIFVPAENMPNANYNFWISLILYASCPPPPRNIDHILHFCPRAGKARKRSNYFYSLNWFFLQLGKKMSYHLVLTRWLLSACFFANCSLHK